MKLYYKLTFIYALSRILIVAAFVIFVPTLFYKAAILHTDDLLSKHETEFLHIMNKIGVNQFIQEETDSIYADYTIFHEKYVSIEPTKKLIADTIVTGRRDI